ncbi:MAG: CBS domain-containing protein [Candidatus Omnitrophota bacterium]
MRKGKDNAVVYADAAVKKVLLKITGARAGCACIINEKGILKGIFTDGDLRRAVETSPHILEQKIQYIMTKDPITVSKDSLAVEALRILMEKKIDEVPVVDKKHRLVGLLDVQDLLKEGLL